MATSDPAWEAPVISLPSVAIIEELERSHESIVYNARAHGQIWALKVSRTPVSDSDRSVMHRFRREACLLSRFYPFGLPAVMEVGSAQSHPYMITERIHGNVLSDVILEQTLSARHTVEIGIIVANVLTALHQQGLVHCDIQPRHVVLEGQKRPRLANLGLALSTEYQFDPDLLENWLYSAPEQADTNQLIDPRADLYSLGGVLFACATGRPPFDADNADEVARLRTAEPAPDVREFNQNIGGALALIIAKLLDPDPDQRYQSAEGLLSDLQRLPELERAHEFTGTMPWSAEERREVVPHRVPLVGRDAEIQILLEAWGTVESEGGQFAMIDGPSGIGKSRLLAELAERVHASGALVLTTRGQRHDPVPLSSMRAALRQIARGLEYLPDSDRAEAKSIISRACGYWSPVVTELVPELSSVLPHRAHPQNNSEMPHLTYDAIADCLLGLARVRGHLLLVIDDVQWLDDSSQQVLLRLASSLKEAPIFLVCAAGDDPESQTALLNLTESLPDSVGRFSLRPLDMYGVGAMIGYLAGMQEVDQDLVTHVLERCEGNALCVQEYTDAVVDAGLLRPYWGRWLVDTNGIEQLGLPADVRRLIISRLRDLRPSTRSILMAATLLGTSFQSSYLAALCGVEEAEVLRALLDGEKHRLVMHGDNDTYVFIHDRIHDALSTALRPGTARRLHQRTAEIYQEQLQAQAESPGADTAALVYSLAQHWSQSESSFAAQSYEANFAAGRRALEENCNSEARKLLALARQEAERARLTPPAEFLLAEADAAFRLGFLDEAEESARAALAQSDEVLLQARVHAFLAYIELHFRLRLPTAWQHIVRGLSVLGAPFPPVPESNPQALVDELVATLKRTWAEEAGDESKSMARSLMDRADTDMDQERVRLCCQLYRYAGETNLLDRNMNLYVVGARAQFALAYELGTSPELALSYASLAVTLAYARRMDLSHECVLLARVVADELKNRVFTARIRFLHSVAIHLSGQAAEGLVLQRQCVESYGPFMRIPDYLNACTDVVWHLATSGHFQEAQSWWTRAVNRVMWLRGYQVFDDLSVCLEAVGALLAAAHGRPQDGVPVIEEMRARMRKSAVARQRVMLAYANEMLFELERGELCLQAENYANQLRAMGKSPANCQHFEAPFYVALAYHRMAELDHADRHRREDALTNLRAAYQDLVQVIKRLPYLSGHYFVIQAALKRQEGMFDDVEAALHEAEKAAYDNNNPWCLFEIALQRGRLLEAKSRAQGAHHQRRIALMLAVENGWTMRERRVRQQFDFTDEGVQSISAAVDSQNSDINARSPHVQRHRDALVRVSLKMASSLDPAEHTWLALAEIVALLGAERAFLFSVSDEEGQLMVVAGCDQDGAPLENMSGYSTTVIERVQITGQPVVLCTTEEGALLGAESIVAHDLRSVLAAPLSMGDRFIGIIYVDSRIAKGIFSDSDLEILFAIASLIAATFEMARMARLEVQQKILDAERLALAKDLELTRAVQTLLLPEEDNLIQPGFKMAAYYRPATQSGGDWWWYEWPDDGGRTTPTRFHVIVGDVTGHGAGAAMVTAAVASAVRTLKGTHSKESLPWMLGQLHHIILGLCGGEYTMALLAAELDLRQGSLSWWSSGGPPLLLLEDGQKPRSFARPGTPLGSPGPSQLGEGHLTLGLGQRVVLMTDGIPDMVLEDGRRLGSGRLMRLLGGIAASDPQTARTELVERLDDIRGAASQEDDETFVIIERG